YGIGQARPWQSLYLRPLPHGHGALRGVRAQSSLRAGVAPEVVSPPCSSGAEYRSGRRDPDRPPRALGTVSFSAAFFPAEVDFAADDAAAVVELADSEDSFADADLLADFSAGVDFFAAVRVAVPVAPAEDPSSSPPVTWTSTPSSSRSGPEVITTGLPFAVDTPTSGAACSCDCTSMLNR